MVLIKELKVLFHTRILYYFYKIESALPIVFLPSLIMTVNLLMPLISKSKEMSEEFIEE